MAQINCRRALHAVSGIVTPEADVASIVEHIRNCSFCKTELSSNGASRLMGKEVLGGTIFFLETLILVVIPVDGDDPDPLEDSLSSPTREN